MSDDRPTQGTDVSDLLKQAMSLQQHGRLAEADWVYGEILRSNADNFDALHLLGLIRIQQRRFDEAVTLIRAATRQRPHSADAFVNLGNALQGAQRAGDAVPCYQQALAIQPNFALAHVNLASAQSVLHHFDEAIANCQRALEIEPTNADAHNNLANALCSLKRYEEAIGVYRSALAARPEFPEALYNLGNAYMELDRYEEAVDVNRQVLASRPDFAPAHNNLGRALLMLHRFEEAAACFRRAIQINNRLVIAHDNLGLVLSASGRHSEAIASHRQALALNPRYAGAQANLAAALTHVGRLDEALESCRRARDLDPTLPGVRSRLVTLKRRMCDWSAAADEADSLISSMPTSPDAALPFTLVTICDDPSLQLVAARRRYAHAQFERLARLGTELVYRHDRIRIGYLSADFHEHATAYLVAELIERHDRGRFEITAFSWGRDDKSAMRRRLEAGFDRFLDVREMSDLDIARKVRDLEIDIAVDLKGYTDECRTGVLARRPAPIQVNYLGYPGTMGASFIDYILVDPFVVPFLQEEAFTEKLVHLPECYQPNDGKREIAAQTPARAECGLPERGLVFACFNNSYKITPAFFDIWMRLLRAVPGSVLWLLQDNKWAPDNLRREARVRGVSPDRLVFAPRCKLPEHLARQRLADLFLDTLPCNAHTTASDALWAGLPVLTCAGRSFAARVAGSLLRAAGLPELVTHSIEDYEALALKLARDPGLLAGIRRKLAANRLTTPLFDCERYCRHLEAAYQHMWRTWQNAEPPKHFAVPALPVQMPSAGHST